MGKSCNFEYSGQRKPPGEGDIQASKSLKEVREQVRRLLSSGGSELQAEVAARAVSAKP